jgi:hypothetical protein
MSSCVYLCSHLCGLVAELSCLLLRLLELDVELFGLLGICRVALRHLLLERRLRRLRLHQQLTSHDQVGAPLPHTVYRSTRRAVHGTQATHTVRDAARGAATGWGPCVFSYARVRAPLATRGSSAIILVYRAACGESAFAHLLDLRLRPCHDLLGRVKLHLQRFDHLLRLTLHALDACCHLTPQRLQLRSKRTGHTHAHTQWAWQPMLMCLQHGSLW